MWQNSKDLLSDPVISGVFGFVGIVVGIIGVIIAIKSRGFSRLSSCHEFTNLIGKEHSKLPNQINVFFEGTSVDSVSSSEFIIWNSGKSVINKDTLETTNPLHISFDKTIKILRCQIKNKNSETANPILSFENNRILITFDFLEKKEGLRIEVLHTGSRNSMQLKGKLIGVKSKFNNLNKSKKIESGTHVKRRALRQNMYKVIIHLIGIAALLSLVVSFVRPDIMHSGKELVNDSTLWPARLIMLMYSFLPAIFYINRPAYPSSLKNKDI